MFVSIMDKNFNMVKLLKRAIITELECCGLEKVERVGLKRAIITELECCGLEKVERVGNNDCEHVEHCNITCTEAFIKHYCYTALIMDH